MTRDGGKTWTNVRPNIPASVVPERTWVSRVEPSHFDAGTAYVSFDGHRSDNFKLVHPEDDGLRQDVDDDRRSTFPAKQPVYVVKEDLKNPRLLFAGTEYGVHASIDGGATWRPLMSGGLPTVAVHDLVIHPRDGDLIAATHGRSLWILDDITPLQQLTPAVLAADAHMFRNKVATIWKAVSRGATRGHLMFSGPQSADDRRAAAGEFTDRARELGDRHLLSEQRARRTGARWRSRRLTDRARCRSPCRRRPASIGTSGTCGSPRRVAVEAAAGGAAAVAARAVVLLRAAMPLMRRLRRRQAAPSPVRIASNSPSTGRR